MPPPLPLFAGASLALHVGVFAALLTPPRAPAAPRFDPTSQTLAGETLLVDPAPPALADDAPPDSLPATPHPDHAPARTLTRRVPAGLAAAASAGSASPASPTAAAPPPTFGAVGVRFATDLATTFTRAFAQAGSADAAWAAAAFGSAGHAEVALELDAEGRLVATSVSGAPSTALRASIERTLVLLAPRAFTARGAVTRLRVAAHVSRDAAHDGLHGDVFALSAGSFSGDVGSAFFALPPGAGPGRRVDVEVRLLP